MFVYLCFYLFCYHVLDLFFLFIFLSLLFSVIYFHFHYYFFFPMHIFSLFDILYSVLSSFLFLFLSFITYTCFSSFYPFCHTLPHCCLWSSSYSYLSLHYHSHPPPPPPHVMLFEKIIYLILINWFILILVIILNSRKLALYSLLLLIEDVQL